MPTNNIKKPPEPKILSSSVINLHLDRLEHSQKNNFRPNQSLNSQIYKQSQKGLHNDFNHNYENTYQNTYQQPKVRKNKKNTNSSFQNKQASQASSFISNQVQFSRNQEDLFQSRQQKKNYQRRIKPNNTQNSEILQQEQNYTSVPNKSKSAKNLINLNSTKLKYSSEIQDKNKPKKAYPHFLRDRNNQQNVQHKIIYENFRQSDLDFLSDQQFLPQGMYPPQTNKKNILNNNSKNSESNHPIFRQTLEYVDNDKYHVARNNFNQIDALSHFISDNSSQQSIPLMNIDDKSYLREKYRKYKQKYNNSLSIIKQLEKLNQTLIKDQRQNFLYYQNSIKDLQNLLMVKDKEIDELNQLLFQSQNQEQSNTQNISSIDGRQMQMDNQNLRKQIEIKNKEIYQLKQKIGSKVSESIANKQKTEVQDKHMQKKIDLIKRQKDSLSKKLKTLEDLNKLYESKLKEKEQRLNKLSQFNSQLQEQIIKLKGKIHSDQTYDTERSFIQDFSKKNKKQILNFSTQTFSKYPIVASDQKFNSPSEIEKYISCIDEQLQLIRTSITKEKNESNQKNKIVANLQRKKQISELDSVSQFQFEEQSQNKLSFQMLQNVVEKLSSFRASMGA